MNLQLHNVISDITGVTGLKIIRAIIEGIDDPKILAQYRDGRCKNSIAVIEKSLQGSYQQNMCLHSGKLWNYLMCIRIRLRIVTGN